MSRHPSNQAKKQDTHTKRGGGQHFESHPSLKYAQPQTPPISQTAANLGKVLKAKAVDEIVAVEEEREAAQAAKRLHALMGVENWN